nr:odorant receptor 68 [Graphosoma rubrolineatum]
MFAKMMKLSGLWCYYDVSTSTKVLHKARAYTFQLINVMAQFSAFQVGLRKLYIESSVGTYITGMMIIHLQLVVFFKNNHLLNQFVYGMREILKKRNEPWQMNVFDQFCSKSWKFINFQYNVLVIFFFFFVICPVAYDLVLLLFFESPEPFFELNFIEGYFQAKIERSLRFYTTLFCTYYQVIVGGMHIIGLLGILPASVAYMCAELRVISMRLQQWSKDHTNPHRDLVLRQIIQEHNDILELIHQMKKYLGELYISQNIIVPLSLTLSLFSVTKALKAGNIDLAIRISYTFFGWTSLAFISCYFSQDLYDESVRLSETLYEIPWYKETPQVRRNLLVMMMVTKKPIVLDYKGVIPMNLRRFREIMNLTYSYFMLLQSMA